MSNAKNFLSESYARAETSQSYNIYLSLRKEKFWKRNGRFSNESFCCDDVDDYVSCNASGMHIRAMVWN